MKKLLVLSLSVLALVVTSSCSGKNDDNKPATIVNHSTNPLGWSGQDFSAQNQNLNSVDIIGGKIVGRTFSTSFQYPGQISQEIEYDSCKPRLKGRVTRAYPGNPQSGVMKMAFDNSGNLYIEYSSASTTLRSNVIRPVTLQNLSADSYALDDISQSLVIGPFTLVGAPSPQHINYILSSRGQLSTMTDQGVMLYNNNPSGGGFRSDYSQGQPLNQWQQNQSQLQQQRQTVVSSNNQITSVFNEGLKASIKTLRFNYQHIHMINISEAFDQTEAIVTSQNVSCVTNYKGKWKGIILQ
ncbi:MAG: hypothetical protein IPM57_04245 [Oligoflexia bacterium]|nr:hypothetical protein [Oligoflexia bacterium]